MKNVTRNIQQDIIDLSSAVYSPVRLLPRIKQNDDIKMSADPLRASDITAFRSRFSHSRADICIHSGFLISLSVNSTSKSKLEFHCASRRSKNSHERRKRKSEFLCANKEDIQVDCNANIDELNPRDVDIRDAYTRQKPTFRERLALLVCHEDRRS